MRFNQSTFTTLNPPTVVAAPTTTAGQYLLGPEGKGLIGSTYTHADRNNVYGTGAWSSSGPWTTFFTYAAYSDNSLIQFMNMALGDGFGASGSSQSFYADSDHESYRLVQWSNGERLGNYRDVFHYNNSTSYAGMGMRLLPIRNIGTSAVTINLSAYASDYYSAGYEGSCLFVLSPSGATYSTAGSISSTLIAQTQTSTFQNNLTGTFSVPAGKTVIVCLASTDTYFTTYRFKDCNYFYGLSTTFSNSNIICDMRMLSALATARFNLTYAGAAASLLTPLWTTTAANYGDR